MPIESFYHPRPPGPKADAIERLVFRLDAQLVMLELSRRHGVESIDRDMDSPALVWQRTHDEFKAALDWMRPPSFD